VFIGIILAGWSSNSKYALLGCLRSAAQLNKFEVAIGLFSAPVIVSVGSLNLIDIVFCFNQIFGFWFLSFPSPFFFFLFLFWQKQIGLLDLPEAER